MEHGERLARIEEAMKSIRYTVEEISENLDKRLHALDERTLIHRDDINSIKRDRKWLFALSGFGFSTAAYALLEYIQKALK